MGTPILVGQFGLPDGVPGTDNGKALIFTGAGGSPQAYALGTVAAGTITASAITDATTPGKAVLTGASITAIRTGLGATTVGNALYVAVDPAAGRAAIGAGTSSLVLGTTAGTALAGDTTFTKTTVGLANVDNTSDAAKPVSTLQAAAIAAKEPTITAGTNSQYWRGDKAWVALDKTAVGLGNVTNTADSAKPVSSAQQAALDLKVDSTAAVHLTGNETVAGNKTWTGAATFSSTVAVPDDTFTIADTAGLQAALDAKISTTAVIDPTDVVDPADTNAGLITGQRMLTGVDAATGGVAVYVWNTVTHSWPTTRTSAAVRHFYSTNDVAATAPFGSGAVDIWFQHKDA